MSELGVVFSEEISAELPVIPGGDQPVEEEEGSHLLRELMVGTDFAQQKRQQNDMQR